MDHKTRWARNYDALLTYTNREGHARVPATHIEKIQGGTISLGDWVSYQRHLYRVGVLSPDRSQMLAGLPGWQWGPLKRGRKMNEDVTRRIKELRRQAMSLTQIASEVKLSRQRVHQILKKEGQ